MINLLPWREACKKHRRHLAMWFLLLPSLLITSLHGLYIGFHYLSSQAGSELIALEKQQLAELERRVQLEEQAFNKRVQQREQLQRLKDALSIFESPNPLALLPSYLPQGIFVSKLGCNTSSCDLVGQAASLDKLNIFVGLLQQSSGIDSVQLELTGSGNTKAFQLNLSLSSEGQDALALH